MHSPDSAPTPPPRTRKRSKPEPAAPHCHWVYVEPTLPPIPTPEQIAELRAAEAAANLIAEQARNRRSLPRRRRSCRVGTSYYAHADRCVPSLRLRGAWLAQLGIVGGDQLRVDVLPNAVLLTRIEPAALPPAKPCQ
ncbi:MAG TPA: SymE family type I addiction module toxin [Stenotrophomonas sp.]|nr:SymE family type I addiction module toxin [Stenotrophomonas sp.]